MAARLHTPIGEFDSWPLWKIRTLVEFFADQERGS